MSTRVLAAGLPVAGERVVEDRIVDVLEVALSDAPQFLGGRLLHRHVTRLAVLALLQLVLALQRLYDDEHDKPYLFSRTA